MRAVYAVGTTVYAATTLGLSISTDGGTNFTNKTTANSGLGASNVRGVFATGSNVYAATAGGLSLSPPLAPTISTVSPSSGSTAGGTSITITGTNFASGGSFGVTVGGVAATGATVVSSTSITATTPAGTAGAVNVVVTNNDGQTATSTGGFTYTAAPAPPAPSGGGESGASSDPSPSASASPTVSPAPAASVPSRLDPVGNPQSPLIPAGGVPAGSTVFLVNGQSSPVTVQPNAPRDPVSLVFSAPGWSMRIEGRGNGNEPLGLTSDQALILVSERSSRSLQVASRSLGRSLTVTPARVTPAARVSGSGFAPGFPVKLYLLGVGNLGTVQTDASGSFDGSVPIPPGIAPGVYTLQANGFAPDYSVRSLSIGALVRSPARTASKSTQVTFDALSPTLTPAAKATLRALVGRTGTKAIKTVSVGYVQPTVSTGNDMSLSLQRAQNAAAYLRSLGVTGAYVVRGDGVASQNGAKARRVNVTITYRAG